MRKILFLTFSTFLLLFTSCGESNSNPDNSINARVMMWKFVERKLKDPSSAKFGTCRMNKTLTNSWKTDCYVDAKNGFGGTVRKNFYCGIKYIADSKSWRLVKLDFQ